MLSSKNVLPELHIASGRDVYMETASDTTIGENIIFQYQILQPGILILAMLEIQGLHCSRSEKHSKERAPPFINYVC